MQTVINQASTLFLILIVGFVAAKVGIIPTEIRKKLATLLLSVAAPAAILYSFQFEFSRDILANMGWVADFGVLFMLLSWVIGIGLWRKSPAEDRKVLVYATVFCNCGYMGFPVLGGLFGQEGMIYVSTYVAVFNLLVFTLGIRIYTGQPQKNLRSLINPALCAVGLGLILFIFQIKLPVPVSNAAKMIGDMTSPLAMLIVGSLIAESKFSELFRSLSLYRFSLLRLIIMLAVAYGIMLLIHPPGIVGQVWVLMAAMPAAANTVLLAAQYDADTVFASKIVTLSTLLYVATVALWMMILGS